MGGANVLEFIFFGFHEKALSHQQPVVVTELVQVVEDHLSELNGILHGNRGDYVLCDRRANYTFTSRDTIFNCQKINQEPIVIRENTFSYTPDHRFVVRLNNHPFLPSDRRGLDFDAWQTRDIVGECWSFPQFSRNQVQEGEHINGNFPNPRWNISASCRLVSDSNGSSSLRMYFGNRFSDQEIIRINELAEVIDACGSVMTSLEIGNAPLQDWINQCFGR